MEITLRRMTPEEFGEFADNSIELQARELAEEEDIPMEDALDEAEEDLRDMLPHGQDTEDNFLCAVISAGRKVGAVWYSFDETEGVKQAFLCDLLIDEAERRKGYGTAALREAEKNAAEFGCEETVLFVSGKNRPARRLFEKCGYERIGAGDGGIYMGKSL